MRKKTNNILKDNGEWLLVDISTPKHPNASMKVDAREWHRFTSNDNFGRVSAVHSKPSDSTLYARYQDGYGRKSAKSKKFHRFVMSEVKCVDHENRDGLDNRKSNLRDGGNSVNSFNQKIRSDNTTGFRGVKLRGDTGKYSACITLNGKDNHLGCFDTAKEAAEAYQSFYAENVT
tara:strand:+ start:259 stop:783 length:525 start_codon:yes stop_codon:yes gene_type:complete